MTEIVREKRCLLFRGTLCIQRGGCTSHIEMLHRCIIGRIMQHGPLKQFHCKLTACALIGETRAREGGCHREDGAKDTVGGSERRREEGRARAPEKRESVKALILNTWVTSQYLDALTRATDISPSGGCCLRESVTCGSRANAAAG